MGDYDCDERYGRGSGVVMDGIKVLCEAHTAFYIQTSSRA